MPSEDCDLMARDRRVMLDSMEIEFLSDDESESSHVPSSHRIRRLFGREGGNAFMRLRAALVLAALCGGGGASGADESRDIKIRGEAVVGLGWNQSHFCTSNEAVRMMLSSWTLHVSNALLMLVM